ncbi:MAG: acetoacetate--CoA ligase [Acidobacteriota bacterium]
MQDSRESGEASRPTAAGDLLWQPSEGQRSATRLAAFQHWLATEKGIDRPSYQSLWEWSVTDLEAFWRAIAEYFEVSFEEPPAPEAWTFDMPGAHFFPGARLNYAAEVLRHRGDQPALIARREDGARRELSRDQLRDAVARARRGLEELGVSAGDRVVGFLPNGVEAVVALLATASLGAVWSSCPPEFGVRGVLDRFQQIEPKVLIGATGEHHNGKRYDRSETLREIVAALPTLTAVVTVGEGGPPGALSWDSLCREAAALDCVAVDFDHPLWVLYSSGTTGPPKAILQGHGGIVLEHLKQLALHSDLKAGDRFFWFSTTGWMMWNYLVGGLMLGATIVLYEGSPGYPDLMSLYRLAAEERVTYFGVSAPFIDACRQAGISPAAELDLSALRGVGCTGSPLSAAGFAWVYDHLGSDLCLGSLSGGTDVCTGFVGPCPLLPVRAGEIQCRSLGAKVESFSPAGETLVGEVGELVLTQPLPSMPVGFWDDPQGERYRRAYFERFPGIWHHGDWIAIDEGGSSVIYGRSDATLNRGGVRMGTAEFYRVVEALPEVVDSLVIDTSGAAGPADEDAGKLWLFVVLAEDVTDAGELAGRIKATLRRELSPRHAPDAICPVTAIPRTRSGKKVEVPLKRLLAGTAGLESLNRGALVNPEAVDALLAVALGQPG